MQKEFELYNVDTKQVEVVPYEQLQPALQSGKYTPKKGDNFNVTFDEAGESGSLPSTDILQALQSGASITPRDQAQQTEYEQKYGDPLSTALATGAGAARGLSFGLSDQALVRSGAVEPDTLKGLKDANPIASGVGEFGAIAGSALLSGGSSALAKGAQVAGKGVLGVAEVASGAGRVAESLLMKEAAKQGIKMSVARSLAAKMVPKIVEGGLEGAAQGAGALLSEQALGDADFNAESILASTGVGGLIGGSLGGVFGAFHAVSPLVDKLGSKASEKLGQFANKENNSLVQSGMSAADSAYYEKTPWGRKFKSELGGFWKDEVGLNLMDDVGARAEKIAAVKANASEKLGQVAQRLDENFSAGIGEAPLMKDYAEKVLAKLEDFKKKNVNIVKRTVEKLDDEVTQVTGGVTLPKMKSAVVEEVNPAQKPIADFVDNQIKFYKGLAQSSEKLSPAELQRFKVEADSLARWDSETGNLKKDIFRQVRSVASDELDNYAGSVDKSLLKELKAQNRRFNYSSEIYDSLATKAERSKLQDFGPTMKDAIYGAAGVALTGDVSGLAVAGARRALNSDARRNAAILFDMEKAAQDTAKYIGKSVKSFLGGVKATVPPVATRAIADSALSYDYSGSKPVKPKNENIAIQNLASNVELFSQSPEKYLAVSARQMSPFYNYIPNIMDAADNKSIQAIAFLAQKMPKRVSRGGMLDNLKKVPAINSLEKAKLTRYINAIENPKSVFADLANGKLSNEGAEVLKTVYPKMFEQAQNQLTAKLSEDDLKLSYQKKLQLSLLLDVPLDASMTGENIMGLQALFNQPPQQASGGAVVDVSNKYDTTTSTMADLED